MIDGAAIQARHPIAADKKRKARQTDLQGENFGQEAAGWIPGWLDALIGVGILGEKMQLLGGDATARIEIRPPFDFCAELQRLHDEAMAMMKRAQAIEISPQTDVDGKNVEQTALMNGNEEQPCGANAQAGAGAQNGAANVDLQPAATSVAGEPATLSEAQL